MSCFRVLNFVLNNFATKSGLNLYTGKEKEWLDQARGGVDIDIKSCTFCGRCRDRCPVSAIDTDEGKRNWEINRMKCVQCGECVDACPHDCLSIGNMYIEPENIKVTDVFDENS